MTLLVALTLIGLSFFLFIAGNRWAAYIRSPVPGLFLADLLLVTGALLSLAGLRRGTRARPWVWVTFGLVALYTGLVLVPEIALLPDEVRYLGIRDAAPFLYLTLVPLLALTLRGLSAQWAIWWVRFSTLSLAMGVLLTYMGALRPTPSAILDGDFVELFAYRPDLTGAGLAIGLLAWSSWRREGLGGCWPLQAFMIVTAGLTVTARSGLVPVVVSIIVCAARTPTWSKGILQSVIGLMALMLPTVMLSAVATLGTTQAPDSQTSPTETSLRPEIDVPRTVGAPLSQANVLRLGTVSARLDTWHDVVTGLFRDRTLLWGGAAGSDYLYELCTGIKDAPPILLGAEDGPKCAVDDYGPNPVVRDPHNWILNIAVTHGLAGAVLFAWASLGAIYFGRHMPGSSLAAWIVGFFLISGATFLISAGYALGPISVALAWIVARTGTHDSKHRPEPLVSTRHW